MIVDDYEEGRTVGRIYETIITTAVPTIVEENDDDFALLCIGDTGTGKSVLMLHTYELFDPETCSVDYIGFDQSGFATALKSAKDKEGRKFVCNDEANISKRKAMTTYNNDLLDTYFAIRGLNIFHWWNNPSVDIIDKPFLERLKGVILIVAPSRNKFAPRVFYYFQPASLLKILEKFGNINLKTLTRHTKKYAYLQSWFKDYEGELKKPYLDKKQSRMHEKIDSFFDKYAEKVGTLRPRDLMAKLDISRHSYSDYHKFLVAEGKLVKDVHFRRDGSGNKVYDDSAIEIFKMEQETRRNKRALPLKQAISKGTLNTRGSKT